MGNIWSDTESGRVGKWQIITIRVGHPTIYLEWYCICRGKLRHGVIRLNINTFHSDARSRLCFKSEHNTWYYYVPSHMSSPSSWLLPNILILSTRSFHLNEPRAEGLPGRVGGKEHVCLIINNQVTSQYYSLPVIIFPFRLQFSIQNYSLGPRS